MYQKIKEKALTIKDDILLWQRDFHKNPELSCNETRTAEKIASELKSMGFEDVKLGCKGKNICVIADLNKDVPGKCIALRADIDALAIEEERDLPHKSIVEGVMHACGHDAHAAMLLGAARLLKGMEKEIPGRVRFIFQHAEEAGKGAKDLIEDRVLDGVDVIFGQHIWSSVESGSMTYCEGPTMASAARYDLKISGRGGHGSMPHFSIDPVIAACNVVNAWQTIVSREVDPLDGAVISVGDIKSGSTFNVIPDSAVVTGTTRTFKPEINDLLKKRMEEVAESICKGLRCEAEFNYDSIFPSTNTDSEFTRFAVGVAKEVLGEDKVTETRPTMGAEDFSHYLQKIPGTFMFLGTRNEEKGMTYPHHHPKFCIDGDVLPLGAATSASIAWAYLNDK